MTVINVVDRINKNSFNKINYFDINTKFYQKNLKDKNYLIIVSMGDDLMTKNIKI